MVAGIVRDADGRVLITDRAQAKSMQDYWEFPGGKIRTGESAQAALSRELGEELGISIDSCVHFHRLSHDYPEIRVAIDFFLVGTWRGTPSGREGQSLRWSRVEDLSADALLPADAPVVEMLKDSGSEPKGSDPS